MSVLFLVFAFLLHHLGRSDWLLSICIGGSSPTRRLLLWVDQGNLARGLGSAGASTALILVVLQVVHFDLSDVRACHSTTWILQLPLARVIDHIGDPHHLLLVTIRLTEEVLSHLLLVESLLAADRLL